MEPVAVKETELLTDDQIEQLLQEAEARLRAKAGQLPPTESEDVIALQESEPAQSKRRAIPRLQHGLNSSSYISEKNGVAQVNPTLLTTPSQQKLADGLRSVETKQRNKKEVGHSYSHTFICMRKINPKTSRRSPAPLPEIALHSMRACNTQS